MKKVVLSTMIATMAIVPFSAVASSVTLDNVGIAINYGLLSGPALELTYPITDSIQIRGALSSGMELTETANDTDIDYDIKSNGGINRLALDYHPFNNGFFLSGGYAVNSFALNAKGSSAAGQVVEIGNETYLVNADVALKGKLDWNNGATLSIGWGHSPAQGWGALVELGAIFTGSADVSLRGTGTVNGLDVETDPRVQEALRQEENKLKEEVADYDFLPVLQMGITYRF